jgi:hypothetical protein
MNQRVNAVTHIKITLSLLSITQNLEMTRISEKLLAKVEYVTVAVPLP